MHMDESDKSVAGLNKKGLQLQWLDRSISTPNYWKWFFLTLIGACLVLPVLLTRTALFVGFDESTGSVGDTIGGIVTPLIALFGVFLTFVAFYIQYKANEQQNRATEQQRWHTRIETFEKVLFTQLEAHEKLKEQINRKGNFEQVLEEFQVLVTEYSRQYRKKDFNTLMNVNPDKSLKLNPVLKQEYLESIITLIEVVEKEGLNDSPEWEERKGYYIKNFIYRKLDLNEKYLLGYMLERKVSPQLNDTLSKYEEIFTGYYKRTGYIFLRNDILAPSYELDFASDTKFQGDIVISPSEIKLPSLLLAPNYRINSAIEFLELELTIYEVDEQGNVRHSPDAFFTKLMSVESGYKLTTHQLISQDPADSFFKRFTGPKDFLDFSASRKGWQFVYTVACRHPDGRIFRGDFEATVSFKEAVIENDVIRLSLKLNPAKMN